MYLRCAWSRFSLEETVNMKLFLSVFPQIDLFGFRAKYKPFLKLNLDMGPNPVLEGPAAL